MNPDKSGNQRVPLRRTNRLAALGRKFAFTASQRATVSDRPKDEVRSNKIVAH